MARGVAIAIAIRPVIRIFESLNMRPLLKLKKKPRHAKTHARSGTRLSPGCGVRFCQLQKRIANDRAGGGIEYRALTCGILSKTRVKTLFTQPFEMAF